MPFKPRKSNRVKVWERDGYCCRYCGMKVVNHKHVGKGASLPANTATIDHIIPKSNPNSSNNLNNLVTACQWCNSSLGARFNTYKDRLEYIHKLLNLTFNPSKYGGDSIKVLSIDPGKTTGILYAVVPDFEKAIPIQTDDVPTILTLIDNYKPDVVVLEQFILRKKSALQLSGNRMYSAEIIGAIQVKCALLNIPIVFQQAYQKDTVSDHLLKHMGLYDKTKGLPHSRDAAKHLIRYCWDATPDVINKTLIQKEGASTG